ncbi:MAG TPA: TadE/TadG family type IV pilus assembly protein [Candidatus Acidoferrales bacterium]
MLRHLKSEGCATARLRGLNGEVGSTLVEFAFVFMILVTMILGITEFTRALYVYHFVSGAARQATHWAAVNGANCGALGDNSCNGTGGMNNGPASSGDIQNYVQQLATAASIDPNGNGCGGSACLTTTANWPVNADSPVACTSVPNAPGCTVEVQVSDNFNFLVPFIHNTAITLSSTSEMVISH